MANDFEVETNRLDIIKRYNEIKNIIDSAVYNLTWAMGQLNALSAEITAKPEADLGAELKTKLTTKTTKLIETVDKYLKAVTK